MFQGINYQQDNFFGWESRFGFAYCLEVLQLQVLGHVHGEHLPGQRGHRQYHLYKNLQKLVKNFDKKIEIVKFLSEEQISDCQICITKVNVQNSQNGKDRFL